MFEQKPFTQHEITDRKNPMFATPFRFVVMDKYGAAIAYCENSYYASKLIEALNGSV
jgi:hypothetical protein